MAESSLLVHYLNRNSADSLSGRKVLRFEPRYSTVQYKDSDVNIAWFVMYRYFIDRGRVYGFNTRSRI